VLFDTYIEGIVCMLIADIIFSMPLAHFHSVLMVGTGITLVLFGLVAYVKKVTRFHEHF
jgi:hypothetical protein